jgi:hypothetical protein
MREQSPHLQAEREGPKLLDLDLKRECRHQIAVITAKRFQNLIGEANRR